MTLDDDLILWQIDLLRHDAWLRKELRAKLTKTQQEALAVLLQSANLSGAQLREMRNIIQQGYNAAGKWLSTSLEALMPVAGDAVADIYAAHTGEVFPVPDHYTLPLVDGASVEEWMTQAGSKQAFTLNRLAKSAEYSTAMSAEIREALARGDAPSDALVRTATATAAGEANLEVMRKSGKVKWLQHKSHLDSKTTLTCRARHNKRWDAKTLAPDGHDYEFKQPPLHWNCRSIIKTLLDDHKDAEDDYDFVEWLEKMPPAIQDKALGKGKAEVWRKAKARGEKITVADLLEQNGRELSLEALRTRYNAHMGTADRTARAILQKAEVAETAITPALQETVRRHAAQMAGLDYRLKSLASLTRKINTKAKVKGISADAAAADIHDVLRYTVLVDEQEFTAQFTAIRRTLAAAGHDMIAISNTWREGAPYKGINTFMQYNGYRYELQFHTAKSFAIKNGKLHELYERFRADAADAAEKQKLYQEMVALSAAIAQPPHIDTIGK